MGFRHELNNSACRAVRPETCRARRRLLGALAAMPVLAGLPPLLAAAPVSVPQAARRLAPDFYVDAAAGDDSADGQTARSAFRTSGRAARAVAGSGGGRTVAFRAGQIHRGTFHADVPNVTLRAFGAGARPILTAYEPLPNAGWTEGGGSAWSRTIALPGTLPARDSFVHVREDGRYLRLMPDAAAVAAVPGSYHIADKTAIRTMLTIHPFGGSDPNGDGKAYDYTAHDFCVRGDANATGWQILDLHLLDAMADDGPLSLVGPGAVVSNCLVEGGSHHAAVLAPGSLVADSEFRDAYNGGSHVGGSVVVFAGTGDDGADTVFRNAVFRRTFDGFGEIYTAFISHTATGYMGAIRFEECLFDGTRAGHNFQAGSADAVRRVAHIRTRFRECGVGWEERGDKRAPTFLDGISWRSIVPGNRMIELGGSAAGAGAAKVRLRNAQVCYGGPDGILIRSTASAAEALLEIEGGVYFLDNAPGGAWHRFVDATGGGGLTVRIHGASFDAAHPNPMFATFGGDRGDHMERWTSAGNVWTPNGFGTMRNALGGGRDVVRLDDLKAAGKEAGSVEASSGSFASVCAP